MYTDFTHLDITALAKALLTQQPIALADEAKYQDVRLVNLSFTLHRLGVLLTAQKPGVALGASISPTGEDLPIIKIHEVAPPLENNTIPHLANEPNILHGFILPQLVWHLAQSHPTPLPYVLTNFQVLPLIITKIGHNRGTTFRLEGHEPAGGVNLLHVLLIDLKYQGTGWALT